MLISYSLAPGIGARRGFTLAEVALALVLGALVLSLIFAIGGRLQKQMSREANRLGASEQLAAVAEVLPIDLRALAPGSGDIASGEARDSSIQLRQAVANALTCGGSRSSWILAPYRGAGGRSTTLTIQDGDTAWFLADGDSSEQWRAVRLRGMHRTTGTCPIVADMAGAQVFDVAHLWSADLRDSVVPIPGAVVRITRPVRFSFYRASDGRWYVGIRTWSSSALQFNGIQPVSGPFGPVAGDRGTRFMYFDAAGNRIASGATDVRPMARVEAVLFTDTAMSDGILSRDSLVLVTALRNRQ